MEENAVIKRDVEEDSPTTIKKLKQEDALITSEIKHIVENFKVYTPRSH